MIKIDSSEITPEHLFYSRRKFLATMGTVLAGSLALSACGNAGSTLPSVGTPSTPGEPEEKPPADELTSYNDVIDYNNFYEFSFGKEGIGELAKDFKTTPWTLEVGGLVAKPQTFSVDDLVNKFPPEERIYRMRCVEAWSMVIPWLGFPLGKLLKEVKPLPEAKYVRFEAVYRPEEMPGQSTRALDWPYIEGLRVDEAMNDLTILATGLYGKPLLPQCGAPIRLVVPWKYGFKSIKAIVKIALTDEMPVSAWMEASPREYGFYANVNPDVPHPRWSQSSERRIGELTRRPTLLFNGYADEVASLYDGMDLKKNF